MSYMGKTGHIVLLFCLFLVRLGCVPNRRRAAGFCRVVGRKTECWCCVIKPKQALSPALVMAKDPLTDAGLHFDELNKLRVLDPEVSQKTTELKEECKDFVDSKFPEACSDTYSVRSAYFLR